MEASQDSVHHQGRWGLMKEHSKLPQRRTPGRALITSDELGREQTLAVP